jgi:hypothetical protein
VLASIKQNAGDRFLFDASDPFNGSDAVTLKQKPQDEQRLFVAQVHIAEKPFGFRLKVTLTVSAEKTLSAFAVFARFDGFELAVMAGHREP